MLQSGMDTESDDVTKCDDVTAESMVIIKGHQDVPRISTQKVMMSRCALNRCMYTGSDDVRMWPELVHVHKN